jgi:polyisoprenyl-phosphate glycosyltransferase
MKKVSLIIPAFNEAENIIPLKEKLDENLISVANNYEFEVLFVNDGSYDKTEEILIRICKDHLNYKFISFSRNFGHQLAIKAGLDHSDGDCVIMMDADLQHPPELIIQMLRNWEEGYDIVNTIRIDSLKSGIFKTITSRLFYQLLSRISEVKVEKGSADFRLIDKKVVDILKYLKEVDYFWRGLTLWVGFKQTSIEYFPSERNAGQSKYTMGKMIKFAVKGITSFSIKPLRLSLFLGILVSTLSFIYTIYALFVFFFNNQVVSGWTSLLLCVLIIGGIQLIILGIIGEYLGKLFIQSKNRPHYIIGRTNLKL